ncbi:response regulator, partial [Burkholderia pseudomallei]|uniref:response regulator n=1 Tax=Burkholderia pseudomallei TaxID=28450 RepID=UPI0021F70841
LRVRFLATRQGRNGPLRLEVRDTGVAIAPQRFTHLFDAYWQGQRCSRPGLGGSGLGLAICRELVEWMRGTIMVDSTPRVETVFTVQLPVTAAEAAPTVRRAATAPVSAAKAASQASRDAPRILIVDDHEAVQAALLDQCDELGCAGIVAGTGEEALRQLAHERVDMVLLDRNLPDIDGYALARMIRQEEATRKAGRVPIISISAVSGDAHRVHCLESGMDGVLGKPLRFEDLRRTVVRWCPTYTAEGSAETSTDR